MKAIVIVLTLIALAGVALGGYSFVKTIGLLGAENEQTDIGAALKRLERENDKLREEHNQLKIWSETKLKEVSMLRDIVAEQAKKIEELKRGAPLVAPARRGSVDRPLLSTPDFEEKVVAVVEKHNRERQQKKSGKQIERIVQKAAEKFDWSDVKCEEVTQILLEQLQRVQEAKEAVHREGEDMTPEQRKALKKQLEAINEEMLTKLKERLTEDEMQFLGRIASAVRGRREQRPDMRRRPKRAEGAPPPERDKR